jgi:[ribosomal protein S5]-alanine N-acetyltransferase
VPGVTASRQWHEGLPVLAAPGLILREVEPADARGLVELFSVPDMVRHIAAPPGTEQAFLKFIRWARQCRQGSRFACYSVVPFGQKTLRGLFQIWPLRPDFQTAEWGFAIARPYWGTGLFPSSARLVVEFAMRTLGVRQLEARAALTNVRGHGALRKLGAHRQEAQPPLASTTGELDRDVVVWTLLSEDWIAEDSLIASPPSRHRFRAATRPGH